MSDEPGYPGHRKGSLSSRLVCQFQLGRMTFWASGQIQLCPAQALQPLGEQLCEPQPVKNNSLNSRQQLCGLARTAAHQAKPGLGP